MKRRTCSLLLSAPLLLALAACTGNQGGPSPGSSDAGAEGAAPGAPSRAAGPATASATPGSGGAGSGLPAKSDLPPDLLRQASVPVEQARAIALSKVPGAALESEELERENGALIYSFDLVLPGRSGIEEVNVDANDASRVEVQHEGPAEEKAEKDAEAQPGT